MKNPKKNFSPQLIHFQKFVDSFTAATSVISVEKLPDGKYGAIRIVAGNKPYIDSIEHAGDGPNLLINKFILLI